MALKKLEPLKMLINNKNKVVLAWRNRLIKHGYMVCLNGLRKDYSYLLNN
jgi:hypothetical protein